MAAISECQLSIADLRKALVRSICYIQSLHALGETEVSELPVNIELDGKIVIFEGNRLYFIMPSIAVLYQAL